MKFLKSGTRIFQKADCEYPNIWKDCLQTLAIAPYTFYMI